jgi:hypothetical protein
MYILLGVFLSMFAWGWWAVSVHIFYASVLLVIACLFTLDASSMLSKTGFFEAAVRIMPKTECCLVHHIWSSPRSVKWATLSIRIVAALVAIAATIVSWTTREKFLNGHCTVISAVWGTASALWILSCIPMFLCLVQCAASSKYRSSVSRKISESEIILRFRKVYTVWLIHDLTLGIFWLYLSLRLFDLSDDEDDSEWRTIFLSMIFWHILVVAFHELYVKQLFSLEPLRRTRRQTAPCCDPSHGQLIWSTMTIVSFVGMCTIVIDRVQHDSLLSMGTHSILSPVLFTCFQVLFVISKLYRQNVTPVSDVQPLLSKTNEQDHVIGIKF